MTTHLVSAFLKTTPRNYFSTKHLNRFQLTSEVSLLLIVLPNTSEYNTAQLVGGMLAIGYCRVGGVLFVRYFSCYYGATALKFSVIVLNSGVPDNSERDDACVFLTALYWTVYYFCLMAAINLSQKYNQYWR